MRPDNARRTVCSRATGRLAVLVGILALISLTAMACGSDDEGVAAAEDLQLTLTEEGLEGLPGEIPAGLVNVEITDQTEGAGGQLDFTRVPAGTDTAEFLEAMGILFEGGPFDEILLDNAGVVGNSTVALDAGTYFVWYDKASQLDRASTADDFVVATLEVTEGDDDATLAGAGGDITAADYRFDIDVGTGPATINFHNEGPDQFHHAVIADFGTNDPDLVAENMEAILNSEGDDLPEGIDGSQINFEFAQAGVFGPDGEGTFQADFEPDRTYVAFCFIQDRDGGAPHAIEHDMYEVFQVDAS